MKLSHTAVPLEVKFAPGGATAGSFEGYGAVFGNRDAFDDVIASGAFKASLARWRAVGSLPKMMLQHGGVFGLGPAEDGIPIGQWLSMQEDSKGLAVKGQLFALDTQKGRYIYEGMRAGVLNGLSIGYITIGVRYGEKPGDPSRTLTEVDVHECSVVTFPANQEATVTAIKAQRAREEEILARIKRASTPAQFRALLHERGLSPQEAAIFLSKLTKAVQLEDARRRERLGDAGAAIARLVDKLRGR